MIQEPDANPRPTDVVVWILCAAAAVFSVWALHVGWRHSILDLHIWRQSHTALSAWEMVRGGPFWRYVTPIVGPPWSSPLELPLYQWIVAMLVRARSLDLETTGRAVSVAFFCGTLVSYWFALEILEIAPRYRPAVVALVLVSPLYIFWSRAFMIESTALFFAVTYLLAVHHATKDGGAARSVWLAVALVAGVVGSMAKVTTFVPWWTGAAVLLLYRFRRGRLPSGRLAQAVVLAVPVVTAAGWLHFTDVVKAANPLSERLAWSTVAWHHFGALSLRFHLRSWYAVPANAILGRTPHMVVGNVLAFAGACAALAIWRRRLWPALVCAGLYMLPIAIFMYLYLEHVYYPYASSLLLITFVGCGIVTLVEQRGIAACLGVALLAVALASAARNYLRGYYVAQQSENTSHWPLAHWVGEAVPARDVLLIYGLDLSTEFPYTSHHRSIMSWEDRGAGDPRFERSLALLADEGSRVGALVACGDSRPLPVIPKTVARLALSPRPSYRDSYCNVYFPPGRLPPRPLDIP